MHKLNFGLIVCLFCVCICVFVCVYFRVDENASGKSPVAGTNPLVNRQQPVLQDDYVYASVNDAQQQIFALSDNPAYKKAPEHSQKSLEEDDQAYSTIDISQRVAVVTYGIPNHGTSLRAAASDK